MLYTRSSFLKWLREENDCTIIVLDEPRSNCLKIINGPAIHYMWLTKRDVIDYEEIYIAYQKLYLAGLPGDKDLERIE